MSGIGAYIFKVCCSAIIAAVLSSWDTGGPAGKMYRIVIGSFMAFIIVSPMRQYRADYLSQLPQQYYRQGQAIAADAQLDREAALQAIITENLRAYILNEASRLRTEVRVEALSLDADTYAPSSVSLSGAVSLYDRMMLTDFLETSLGIGREHQIWLD